MNDAQKALLGRLREIVEEAPRSGALNAGGKRYYPTRFAGAVERRADDGVSLVEYVLEKVYEPPTDGYDALVAAGRSDLTVEASVADESAPWAPLFTEADRAAASVRLGAMQLAHQEVMDTAEVAAVAHDRKVVALVNERRVAQRKPALTPQQQSDMMTRLAAERAGKG